MKQKKQKKKNQSTVFGGMALLTFVVAMVLAIFGLASSVNEIERKAIARTPEAILASAGVSEDKNVFLSVAYFDQKADECVNIYDVNSKELLEKRQFEWSECEYYNKAVESGLVDFKLDDKYLPVALGGKLTSNRGLSNMKRWFEAVDGKSKSFTGNIKLDYKAEGAEFSFHQDNFYPLDEVEFSAGDKANVDGHNHLFTMNFAVPFTVLRSGNESFEITADDDTFVFVGDELVVDMGGVHDASTGRFVIKKNGEVYSAIGNQDLAFSGVTVGETGNGSIVRIFHADRDSEDSVFKVAFKEMNLIVTDTKLADRKDDGVQIAYDPTDPTYVAPLGESSVVRPDGTRGLIIIATIEGVMVVAFAIFVAIAIRSIVKRELAKRQQ